jgi:hypothetical protein
LIGVSGDPEDADAAVAIDASENRAIVIEPGATRTESGSI